MVVCGAEQGRSVFAPAGVAALRQGLRKRENAGLGCKMSICDFNESEGFDLDWQAKVALHKW